MTSAAGTDIWDRTWIGWDTAFGAALAVGLVVAATDDDRGSTGRTVALVALVLLGAAYAGLGARALRADDSDRLAWAYVVLMVPLFLAAYTQVGEVGLMLFVLYPQVWALFERPRAAVAVTLLLSVSVGAGTLVAYEDPAPYVAVQVVVSLGFSVSMGLWVTGIVRQSAGRKAVIAELEATRAELADVSREAGVRAERERLAGEIHDTLAQGFTSVVMLLELADSELGTDPGTARRRLATARDTARQNLAEARALVAALTPADLQEAPLPQAIGRLADRFAAETGVPARLTVGGEPRPLPANEEVVLLRAAQEALANVRKHSGAGRVGVELRYREEGTTLTVVDDGRGFDPAVPSAGYGLAGMRRRVEDGGGTLTVTSGPAGTTVAVRC